MFTERERAFIQTQRLLRLATVAADGQPDADAVDFVVHPASYATLGVT